MDALPLQVLVLKGVALSDLLHALNDNMPADSEIPIPAGTYLRRDVLKAVLFRFHPVGCPFIGVIVAAGFVLLKYIGPLPVQGISQVLQQHL